MDRSVYRCGDKKCTQYHVEVIAASPAAFRRATGGFVRCKDCGEILWYVRKVQEKSV